MSKFLIRIALFLSLWIVPAGSRGQQVPSASAVGVPEDKLQYAPDRDYDLQHIAADLTIDYAQHAFQGSVVNTLAPLREGVTKIQFDCGENLTVTGCEVAGQKATFTREKDKLKIIAPQPLPPGKPVALTIRYFDSGKKELPNFRWLKPTAADPQRIGFWTNGEPYFNRQWLPTWDYPNDFATTEVRVTVPADWYVISNGILASDTLHTDAKKRTFHWKMDQPYATYLISLVGGPFDVKTADWQGIPLMYLVPKGKGDRIDDTFGDTPDILSFFSDRLGVKYPWPKYAQTAAYDFPGGMENASATTIGVQDLADSRHGYKTSVRGVAHELAHQWFGDLVTCGHWGELWLNEGFADLLCDVYLEYTQGKTIYDYAVHGWMQGYLSESRRYKRPLATNLYADSSSMLDSHSYKKGAAILHTLRRQLGDKAFFTGLHHYLTQHRHQTVNSHVLCRAMTEATGINLEAFFDQWVYKPGHPILDYTWRWDEENKQVVLTIRQTQDTKDGTPIYSIHATVGMIDQGVMTRAKVRLHHSEQKFRLDAARKPNAVLLDPDHDFLREIPALHWTAEELPSILNDASNAVDRAEAMNRILAESPSDAMVQAIVKAVREDKGPFVVFRDISRLGELKREDLRPLFVEQLSHPNMDRRTQAILALGQLSKSEDKATTKTLRDLVNDKQPYKVVRAAISTLGNWDASAHRDIFQSATKLASPLDSIRLVALDGLTKADAAEGKAISDPHPETTRTVKQFLSDRANGVKDSPVMTAHQRVVSATNQKGNAMIASVMKSLQSFVPLAHDHVETRGIEESGERISRVAFYKMVTGQGVWYLRFSLTAEGKVAALRPQDPSFQ